ncbi:MAG: hypothetical protein AB8I08_25155 [Sandaracinaceae bacterium]
MAATSHEWLAVGAISGLLLLPSCGPQSRATETAAGSAEVRTLSEGRALTLINEVFAEEGVPVTAGWTLTVGQDTALPVDLRVADSHYGLEWMSAQDRVDLGDAIPGPTDNGQLRLVPGRDGEMDAQVWILEHTRYEYANEREHVQSGVSGAGDAEARLRQDARDFLHYVRGQGAL